MSPEPSTEITGRSQTDPARQLWLEQRFAPLAAPYVTSDCQNQLPLAGANRRLTLEALDLCYRAIEEGMVEVSGFDADNIEHARNNLADPLALRFDLTSKLADWLKSIFASRMAAEMEAFGRTIDRLPPHATPVP